ncbi:MAG: ribosomal protein S18-alanine N-acetyltransferase [Chloroflexota bacterium]
MSEIITRPKIVMRDMQLEDLEAVMAIEEQLFAAPWSIISYRFEVQNQTSQNWVVEVQEDDGKRVIGMIVVWLLADKAYIANIGVEQAYQRQGIGCRLLKRALESCTRMGAKTASLEVRESNRAAKGMYAQFGFEQVGRNQGYYQDNNEDALLFTLKQLDVEQISQIVCQTE